jgi:class 3 adenylate cyclase/predicted Ser/Thr protein kinase/tetratricopeptide (TPR) repeat protein
MVARAVDTDALLGRELAGYRVLSRVGRGGMGVVYECEDLRLGRRVALKVLAPALATDERFRARFLRESRLAAALDHPNIVPVYEAGEASGELFIAMRFVDGVDLGALLERDDPLSPGDALGLVEQVARALDSAHRHGIVHRDVKPANILVAEEQHPYLTDFGLSQLAGVTSRSRSGQFIGTVAYVSPEQIGGEQVGPAADVYALGAVLVECLTGAPPYPHGSDLAVLWAHIQDDPPSVSARRPELPIALDAVVARALAKEPEHRFATCSELAAAARTALNDTIVSVAVPQAKETRTVAAVLSMSLTVSSEAGAPLDPETVKRVGERMLGQAAAVAVRHGGVAERAGNDRLRAIFGVPVAREDDALRSVRAAAELRARVAVLAAEIGVKAVVRVGIGAGEVVASSAGAVDVAGEPVQNAAALERAADDDEILLARDVHALLRGAAVAEAIERGEAGLHHARRFVELRPGPPAPRPDAPLVGRERELNALLSTYREAVESKTCRLVTISGATGIGKTRLAAELAARLGGEARVLTGRCLSYGEGITYWPMREIVLSAVDGDTAVGIDRLLEGEADAPLIAKRVAGAIGLAEAGGGREETFWALRRFLEHLARRRPLVLVVEDVQWAEPTLLDLVEHLAELVRDAPVLLACLARPELFDARSALGSDEASLSIELEPLAGPEAALLVEHHAGAVVLPSGIVAEIVRLAEGNPLFLEQLLVMAAEEPANSRRATLPPAIHGLLVARLDRLSPAERLVIECASIEGQVFHVGPLAELCPEIDPISLGRHLLALTRKQLVRPDRSTLAGEEALRFHHGLIREAAYESLTQERRAILHERFANALERVATSPLTEEAEFVGYHLEQAVAYRRALGTEDASIAELCARSSAFLGAAGRGALARGDFRAGQGLLDRAARLLPAGDRQRALLEIDRCTALLDSGHLAEAEAVASAVEERAADDPGLAAHAAVERLIVRYSLDLGTAIVDLERRGEELERLLEGSGDDRGLRRFWLLQGLAHWAAGRLTRAEETWERAAVHAQENGDAAAETDLLGWLASAAFWGPTPVTIGVRRCEEALERLYDRPFGAAYVVQFLAGLHAMAGRFDLAEARFREVNSLRADLGVSMQWPVSQVEALAAGMKGNLDGAREMLQLGCARLEEMGERSFLATMTALLSRVVCEQGQLDDALRWADQTRDTAGADDVVSQATWRGVRARILARGEGVVEAERLAREAVALAAATDYVSLAGEALLDLAAVLVCVRRPAESADATRQALALFERKENSVAASRARALLANGSHR